MTRLELSSVSARRLNGCDLVLEPGVYGVLGTNNDGTDELVELLAGALAPRRGRLRIDGGNPRRDPVLRRRIGTMYARERLPLGKTVHDKVARALEARRSARSVDSVLADAGLEGWSRRLTHALSAADRRRIALALALSVESPLLIALSDPLAHTPGVQASTLSEELARRGQDGTIVVYTTPSVRDVMMLGGSVISLERGRFTRRLAAPLPGGLVPGKATELAVESDEPRLLAAALCEQAAIQTVSFADRGGSGAVIVTGSDAESVALAVMQASRVAGASLRAMTTRAPELTEVQAASSALLRAAYDNAYRAAGPAGVAPAPLPAAGSTAERPATTGAPRPGGRGE